MGTIWDNSTIMQEDYDTRQRLKYRRLGPSTPYAWVYGKQDRWFHRDHGAWHEIPEPWFARVRDELNRNIRAGLVAGGPALPPPEG